LSHGWPPTTATQASSLKASKVFENMRPFSVHEGQELILLVRRVQQLNTPMHVELGDFRKISYCAKVGMLR
jgi:hypothetical protein